MQQEIDCGVHLATLRPRKENALDSTVIKRIQRVKFWWVAISSMRFTWTRQEPERCLGDKIPKSSGLKARTLLVILKILANNHYQVQLRDGNGPSSVKVCGVIFLVTLGKTAG